MCTGNICRSPIAERLLSERNKAENLGLTVSSAGTRARNGEPMHPESRRVLGERGVDADGFSSRLLTERIAAEQDLILCLAREHRAAARQLAPVRWKRMFVLREVPRLGEEVGTPVSGAIDPNYPGLDIVDPIGRSPAVFDSVADDIEEVVDILTAWIVRYPGKIDAAPWIF